MYTVAALYKFSTVDDPNTLQNKIRKRFKQLKIYGTILVGKEGINGTISAEQKNLQKEKNSTNFLLEKWKHVSSTTSPTPT